MNKMSKKLKYLLALFVLAICILSSLLFFSPKPNDHKNGFVRHWLNMNLVLKKEVEIKEDLTDIAGTTQNSFFFYGNDPNVLAYFDKKLSQKKFIHYKLPNDSNFLVGFDIKVDSPIINIFSRNESAVLSFKIGDSIGRYIKLKAPLFTRVQYLSTNKIILRAFDSSRRSQEFQIVDLKDNIICFRNAVFNTMNDAGFLTDGFLQFDSATKLISYIRFYNNTIVCMDTSLKIKYIKQTIDTTNADKIKLKNSLATAHSGSLKPSQPVSIVNIQSSSDNGYLYNLSGLKSDNETSKSFSRNSVIDVYSLISGDYTGSLYIPYLHGQKLTTFKVMNKQLLVVYPNYIALFELNKL